MAGLPLRFRTILTGDTRHWNVELQRVKRLSPPTRIPEHPAFRGFDVEDPSHLPGYRRDLPHLRLEGATYFATFRLADSIPRAVAWQWQASREHWLLSRGVNPRWEHNDPARWNTFYSSIPAPERQAFERSEHQRFFIELDKCHGSCLLKKYHGLVASALEFFHGKRVWTGDYVVMPNHVHVLVQPFPGVKLEEWLYSLKRFTSTRMVKDESSGTDGMMRSGHVWQTESFDRVVRDLAELARTRRYIANNSKNLRSDIFGLKQMEWLDQFAGRG